MKEAFEKITKRLEDAKEQALKLWDGNSRYKGFCQAIDIVNQVAEEYNQSLTNDGWIPCSERKPEIGQTVLATVSEECILIHEVIAIDYDEEFWQYFEDGSLLAWQPLPTPYQPKEPRNE